MNESNPRPLRTLLQNERVEIVGLKPQWKQYQNDEHYFRAPGTYRYHASEPCDIFESEALSEKCDRSFKTNDIFEIKRTVSKDDGIIAELASKDGGFVYLQRQGERLATVLICEDLEELVKLDGQIGSTGHYVRLYNGQVRLFITEEEFDTFSKIELHSSEIVLPANIAEWKFTVKAESTSYLSVYYKATTIFYVGAVDPECTLENIKPGVRLISMDGVPFTDMQKQDLRHLAEHFQAQDAFPDVESVRLQLQWKPIKMKNHEGTEKQFMNQIFGFAGTSILIDEKGELVHTRNTETSAWRPDFMENNLISKWMKHFLASDTKAESMIVRPYSSAIQGAIPKFKELKDRFDILDNICGWCCANDIVSFSEFQTLRNNQVKEKQFGKLHDGSWIVVSDVREDKNTVYCTKHMHEFSGKTEIISLSGFIETDEEALDEKMLPEPSIDGRWSTFVTDFGDLQFSRDDDGSLTCTSTKNIKITNLKYSDDLFKADYVYKGVDVATFLFSGNAVFQMLDSSCFTDHLWIIPRTFDIPFDPPFSAFLTA